VGCGSGGGAWAEGEEELCEGACLREEVSGGSLDLGDREEGGIAFCWKSRSGLAFHVENELGIFGCYNPANLIFEGNGNIVYFGSFEAGILEFRG